MNLTEKFPNDISVTPYEELRGELKNGDVLICSGNGFFSTMIQKTTKSDWSHVGLILCLEEIDRVMLLESVESIGVRTVRLSKYLESYSKDSGQPYGGGLAVIRYENFENLVDKESLKDLAQFAVDNFGYPYDNDEIAKIAARILSSKIGFEEDELEKIKPDREFICSEYVARCYEKAGVEIRWNKLGFIAPSDFAKDENFKLVGVMKGKG